MRSYLSRPGTSLLPSGWYAGQNGYSPTWDLPFISKELRMGVGSWVLPISADFSSLSAIMEIRKLFEHVNVPWKTSFWRTPKGLECDLVLSSGGRLVPIEVKHGATMGAADFSSLHSFLDDHPKASHYGILLTPYPRLERVSQRVFNIPLRLILNGPQLSLLPLCYRSTTYEAVSAE